MSSAEEYVNGMSAILKKYNHGRDLDSRDDQRMEELCLTGRMNTGISIKREAITATTTDTGRDFIIDLRSYLNSIF